jgi:hypothetical protein
MLLVKNRNATGSGWCGLSCKFVGQEWKTMLIAGIVQGKMYENPCFRD